MLWSVFSFPLTERLTVRTADCVSVSPLYGRLQSGCGAVFFMQLLQKYGKIRVGMPRYESSEKRARELSREGWRYERREGAPKTCLCLFSRFSFLFRRPLSWLRWIRLEEESFLSYPVRLHAEERPRAPNPSRAPERSAQREAMVTWLVDSGCTSQRRSS